MHFTSDFIENNIDDGVSDDLSYSSEGDKDAELLDFPSNEVDLEEEIEEEEDGDSVDSRGVSGWQKVDKLARALLRMDGLSIQASEANEVVQLYDQLEPFDKKPLTYKSVLKKVSSGRFGSRKRLRHVGIVAMKICFITAGSPALPPSKSRLVEALCIHLSNDITAPRTITTDEGDRRYESRWKLILAQYRRIQARLFNSQDILEKTNMSLYNINECSLRLWYKNSSRLHEITTLLQGWDISSSISIATTPLPPVRPKLSRLQGQSKPMEFLEPEDCSNMAKLVFRTKKDRLVASSSATITKPLLSVTTEVPTTLTAQTTQQPKIPFVSPPPIFIRAKPLSTPQQLPVFSILPMSTTNIKPSTRPTPLLSPSMPKSTYYRNLKKAADATAVDTSNKRKIYSCRKCGEPMAGGHSQYRGQRYCPNEPGALPLVGWMAEKKQKRSLQLTNNS